MWYLLVVDRRNKKKIYVLLIMEMPNINYMKRGFIAMSMSL